MQIGILVAEMIVIFLLILMGCAGYRSGRISDSGVKTCSYLVVNLCNPALLLSNAIAEEAPVPAPKMRAAIYAAVLVYVILIPLSYLISRLIRAPEKDDYAYRMMTIYGNVGFIGIPVCSAVLGSASLLYISINCMVFNVTFYTYGMASMRRAARLQTGEARKPVKASEILKDIINVGTVSSFLSVLIYMLDPKVPMILADSLRITGNATVFLSMIVLGASLAQSDLREMILADPRMYLFLPVRMLLIPAIFVTVFSSFIKDPVFLGTTAILVSLPGANLPLMYAKELELDDRELSRGIILSTVFSLVTIPLVCVLL